MEGRVIKRRQSHCRVGFKVLEWGLRSKKKGKQKIAKEDHVTEALDKLREQTRETVKGLESLSSKQQPPGSDDAMVEDWIKQFEDLVGSKFVLEAATKHSAEIATHRHGCCVLQCCLSNTTGEQRERLITEIASNSLHLSQDPFGNYVVQYLTEHKVYAVKLLIQFRVHYAELATQKFSSHVVEKCLKGISYNKPKLSKNRT